MKLWFLFMPRAQGTGLAEVCNPKNLPRSFVEDVLRLDVTCSQGCNFWKWAGNLRNQKTIIQTALSWTRWKKLCWWMWASPANLAMCFLTRKGLLHQFAPCYTSLGIRALKGQSCLHPLAEVSMSSVLRKVVGLRRRQKTPPVRKGFAWDESRH